MKNENNAEKMLELAALSTIAQYPERALNVIDKLGITAADFSPGPRCDAFNAMLRSGGDSKQLLSAINPILPEQFSTDDDTDDFLNLIPSIGEVEHHLIQFLQFAIRRELGKQLWATAHNHDLPPALLASELSHVIEGYSARLEQLTCFISGTTDDDNDDRIHRTPDELLDVPGFVHYLVEYTLSVAPRPNRVLAFAGALSMLSFLAARKYTDKYGTATNIYIIALANSGVGKDIIRKVNKRLADNVDLIDCIADGFASGEGMEDALFMTPAKLAQIDEFSTLLNSLKDNTTTNEHLLGSLLTFFTESSSVHTVRGKAMTAAMRQSLMENPSLIQKMRAPKIYHPSLTLLATSIPDKFYTSLTPRLMDNGLLARFLVFEAGERGEANLNNLDQTLPANVLGFAQELAAKSQNIPRDKSPEYTIINDAEGSKEVRARIRTESDALHRVCEKNHDLSGMSVWNRAVEITNKLALLYALSENLREPMITPPALEWAWKVVSHSSKRMLKMCETYVDGDDASRIYQYLLECENCSALRSKIGRDKHLKKLQMDQIQETLLDRDLIEVIPASNNGTLFRAKKVKRSK